MGLLAALAAMAAAIATQPAFVVSGVLRAGDGRPLLSATVKLHAVVDGRVRPAKVSDVRLRPDGGYAFVDVLPGQYILRARGETERDGVVLFASFAVTVQGRDVAGADLTLAPGAIVEGRVTFETRPGMTPPPLANARVRAPMNDDVAFGDVFTGTIDPRGAFALRDVAPGLHQLVVEGLPFPWLLSEGSHRGRALLGFTIETTPGVRLTDVQLTLAERAADLIGTVKVPADGSPAGAIVVAFPADRGLRLFPGRYVRAVRPDGSGGYRAAGLPPGEYFVTAVSGVDETDATGPALLARLEAGALRLSLPPATVTVRDLVVTR
ncbi:MAG: carboxypeptidase-like regulatory domain-containing protein [Vicinamibacterales bacterium]